MSNIVTLTLNSVTCCHKDCAVVFGLNADHERNLRQTHAWFYCPNGHHQHYPHKSDVEIQKERAEAAERDKSYLVNRVAEEHAATMAAQRRTLAYQGHLGKLKKRIANGVCPCCKRTFGNVARHIASQHPDYAAPEFVMPRSDERPEATKRITTQKGVRVE